jgi:hypothetical protein
LHDGVIDGAEIQATLMNTKTIVDASCYIRSVADSEAFHLELQPTKSVLKGVKYAKTLIVLTTVDGVPVTPSSIDITAYDVEKHTSSSSSSQDGLYDNVRQIFLSENGDMIMNDEGSSNKGKKGKGGKGRIASEITIESVSEEPVDILDNTELSPGKAVVSFQSKLDIFFIKVMMGEGYYARERTEMVVF